MARGVFMEWPYLPFVEIHSGRRAAGPMFPRGGRLRRSRAAVFPLAADGEMAKACVARKANQFMGQRSGGMLVGRFV